MLQLKRKYSIDMNPLKPYCRLFTYYYEFPGGGT